MRTFFQGEKIHQVFIKFLVKPFKVTYKTDSLSFINGTHSGWYITFEKPFFCIIYCTKCGEFLKLTSAKEFQFFPLVLLRKLFLPILV